MSTAYRPRAFPDRALSIRQPWVELILLQRKRYEIRSWRTSYRGTLLLHAGTWIELEAVRKAGLVPETLPLGCYVGTADVVGCTPFTAEMANELHDLGAFFGEWQAGLFAWELVRASRLHEPIPAKGRLGLYRPDLC